MRYTQAAYIKRKPDARPPKWRKKMKNEQDAIDEDRITFSKYTRKWNTEDNTNSDNIEYDMDGEHTHA